MFVVSVIIEVLVFSDEVNVLFNVIVDNFSEVDVVCVKEIECIINYDVKVVEYLFKEKVVDNVELNVVNEFIYFVCILEDINNLFYGLMFIEVCDKVLFLYCD